MLLNKAINIKIGSYQIDKCYLGETLLWCNGVLYIDILPTRIYYILGETVNISGIKVIREGTKVSEEVPEKALKPFGFDSSTVGIKTVTLQYVNKTVDYEVGVTNLVDADNKIMLDADGKLLII